ncbi:MAG: isopentenyl-diphosphate Delta-isomerase, partial [Anaerolineales bacterium]|nr:isopentenyl-diphosphate Delta-isomerase [Anaerolineales bacterium]
MTEELAVLVNDQDEELGVVPKKTLHGADTPLHRGFSVYLFNTQGEVLVQQRKKEKITWGGFWSNSCCGHPAPGEQRENTVQRRSKEELGVDVTDVKEVSKYRYRFENNGVVENEVCPIFVGYVAG